MDKAWSERQRIEWVYDAIFEAICEGSLKPGEPLARARLAERLQVSRAMVIKALGRLEQQGIVYEAGRRGLQVAPFDPDFVRGMFDLRAMIDGLAAAEVARRGGSQVAVRGRELLANGFAALKSGSDSLLCVAEREFHGFIYDVAGNPLIIQFQANIWGHTLRLMRQFMRDQPRRREGWLEHEGILEAIIAKDAEAAEALARDHVTVTGNYYLACIGLPTGTASLQRH